MYGSMLDPMGFPGGSVLKNMPTNTGDMRLIPGSERSPWMRKWRSTPAVLPEESLWTEDPGGLHSIGSQSIRHD